MELNPTATYPYQAPIDAYGNGGFRFAEMSHKGSLLCLPDGMHGWRVLEGEVLDVGHFARVLASLRPPGFLLLGTGGTQVFPSPEVRAAFASAGLGLEIMSTGSACRTYNVLLAEHRTFAAALIATD